MSSPWSNGQKAAVIAGASIPSSYAILRWKYPHLWTDIKFYRNFRSFYKTLEHCQNNQLFILDFFEAHAKKRPNHPCILFQDEAYTYAEVAGNVNRTARWVSGSDPSLKKGDAVCVLLHNGPTIVWTWLGLQKKGFIASMINYNLKGAALLHCIQASNSKYIIFGSEFLGAILEILPAIQELQVGLWMINDARIPGLLPPDDVVTMEISTVSGEPLPSVPITGIGDVGCYIFTSGTTGMPKPAIISHSRPIGGAMFYHTHTGLCPDDVHYIALPMYHSAALLMATSGSLFHGATMAIAKKFSASNFWKDIRRYRATIFQYIGEICRYLLAQPKKENDGHYPRPVRAIGNGLRRDIWEEFKTRFNISQIYEFYGATESNYASVNTDGHIGCVGRYSWLLQREFDNVEIVACDVESGEPKRGRDGLCIQLPRGSIGLMLTKITEVSTFVGYQGPEEMTKKKIVRDVKMKGDSYFNSSDLMMIDVDNYIYFIDRLGDTFRWKGENVSTMEVSHALSSFPAILEANVYGVFVPGHDGKAGMASIVLHKGDILDLHALYEHITSSLPDYARPKFLRLLAEMEITATFKHKKSDLSKRGFAPDGYGEVYIINPSKKTYEQMNNEHIKIITAGHSKL